MTGKRLIIIASLFALVVAGFAAQPASASIGGIQCRFDLIKDRFDAVDGVITASKNFTKDVTEFIDVGAATQGEINGDYRLSLRDLADDYRFGLSDINDARRSSVSDMRADCNNLTLARVQRELAFYNRMDHRLKVTYHKAKFALHQAYLAALVACCGT